MEHNGTEWLCPSCKKEKSAKERESKLKSANRNIINRAGGKQSIQNMYGLNYFYTCFVKQRHKVFVRLLLFLCCIFC